MGTKIKQNRGTNSELRNLIIAALEKKGFTYSSELDGIIIINDDTQKFWHNKKLGKIAWVEAQEDSSSLLVIMDAVSGMNSERHIFTKIQIPYLPAVIDLFIKLQKEDKEEKDGERNAAVALNNDAAKSTSAACKDDGNDTG